MKMTMMNREIFTARAYTSYCFSDLHVVSTEYPSRPLTLLDGSCSQSLTCRCRSLHYLACHIRYHKLRFHIGSCFLIVLSLGTSLAALV